MTFLLNKIKTVWNTFLDALFKRYIKSGQKSFEQDKDKELSREIARYYLIERDRQKGLYQMVYSLILFIAGVLLFIGGLYKIEINNGFKWIWASLTIGGTLVVITAIITYCKLMRIWNKHHLDKALVTTYKELLGIPTLPMVTTTPVSFRESMAYGGGNVVLDGGSEVTVRGICWNVSPYPSITDCMDFTQDDNGTGKFLHIIGNLHDYKKYHVYVRAYAINSVGIAYGNQVEFPDQVEFIG